jgi:hydroxymethylbilane synthase
VHSSKDMPAVLAPSLAIGGVLPREDPLDAVVLPKGAPLKSDSPDRKDGQGAADTLGSGGTGDTIDRLVAALRPSPSLGTGSVRRMAQLKRLVPGVRFTPIRGNLDTRLRKLDDGEHDALLLAAAGLRRLGLASRISLILPVEVCVPAPGQGIVAIEIRRDDASAGRAAGAIDDPATGAALRAERALVDALGGGCQTPIGALASPLDGEEIELVGVVVALDGSRAVRRAARGMRHDGEALGARLGAELLADGAAEILAEARSLPPSVANRQAAAMTDD